MRFVGVNPGEQPDLIIVGLGNPGESYMRARMNIGFRVVDYIDSKCMLSRGCKRMRHYALTDKCLLNGWIVLIAKPTHYVKNSGIAVKDILDYYRIKPNKLVVIHDDINVKTGEFKIKKGGRACGHDGIKSIIEHLGTGDFVRIRVGVGPKPENVDQKVFLYDNMTREEFDEIKFTFKYITEAVTNILDYGVDEAIELSV